MKNKQFIYFLIGVCIVVVAFIYFLFTILVPGDKREFSASPPNTVSNSNFTVSEISNSFKTFYLITDKRTGVEYIFNYSGGGVKVDR